MGFSVEYSGLVITQVIYRAALVVAPVRWLLWCLLSCLGLNLFQSVDREGYQHGIGRKGAQAGYMSAQAIRECLHATTYAETITGESSSSSSCAVCLNEFRPPNKVWELRNCCHVYHRRCLNRWLDHDDHKTCPLCRVPLMGLPLGVGRSEPSWAVEKLLYLFGDDLPFAPS